MAFSRNLGQVLLSQAAKKPSVRTGILNVARQNPFDAYFPSYHSQASCKKAAFSNSVPFSRSSPPSESMECSQGLCFIALLTFEAPFSLHNCLSSKAAPEQIPAVQP